MVTSVGIRLAGTPTAAGELRLVFTPKGGETMEILTPIPASASAGTAARELAAALTRAIGPDYEVTVSDAGRISIAQGKTERPFRVKLAAEPPPGMSVRFD
jgi:phage tail sheath gpL-like